MSIPVSIKNYCESGCQHPLISSENDIHEKYISEQDYQTLKYHYVGQEIFKKLPENPPPEGLLSKIKKTSVNLISDNLFFFTRYLTSKEVEPAVTQIRSEAQNFAYAGFWAFLGTSALVEASFRIMSSSRTSDAVVDVVASSFGISTVYATTSFLSNSYKISKNLPSYDEWKEMSKHRDCFDIYLKIIRADEFLDGFVCPLSQDWIRHPVKSRDGTVWEKEYILAWLTKKENEERSRNFSSLEERSEFLKTFHPLKRIEMRASELQDVVRTPKDIEEVALKILPTIHEEAVKVLICEAAEILSNHFSEKEKSHRSSQEFAMLISQTKVPAHLKNHAIKKIKELS